MTHHRPLSIVTLLVSAMALLAWPSAAYAADRAAPSSPQGLRVTAVGYDSVSLTWERSTSDQVAYYQVLRNGQWVDSSYGVTATVRNLSAGTPYVFDVRARDSQGRVSPSVRLTTSTRADAGPPTAPANLRAVTNAGRLVGLTWDASTDDRGVGLYVLFADGDYAFWGGQNVSFLSLVDEFCTVLAGQTYTFTVRAADLTGNLSGSGTPLTITVP